MKRRGVLALLGAVLLLGGAVFLLHPEPEPREEERAPARSAEHEEWRAALRRLAERPAPPARGPLSIRGQVVGPDGPAAGVLVSAVASRPPEGPEADLARRTRDRNRDRTRDRDRPRCEDDPELAAYLEEREVREAEEAPRAWALTDALGAFQLDGLEPGAFLLWAEGPNADVAVRADVPAGSGDVVLRSSPGHFLSGQVHGTDGVPLAGARVLALLEGVGHVVHTVSAEDGRFRLGPLPSRHRSAVLASRDGWMPTLGPLSVDSAAGPLQLPLEPRWEVSGRVLDERGPVAGARVEPSRGVRHAPVLTDAQGRFHLRPLCPRLLGLTALHAGRYVRQRLAPGHDSVELVLAGATQRLTGHVQDGTGRPLADVEVVASPQDREPLVRRTDAQGTFVFESLVPDVYTLRVQAAGYVPQGRPVQLLDAAQTVHFTLAEALRVEGRVVDADGRGVPDARVARTSRGTTEANTSTDARGDFQLDVDAPEPRVVVEHPDFVRLEATLHAPARDVRLELASGTEVHVELVDEHERPVAHARVFCPGPAGHVHAATTDEAGRAVLRGVPSGDWRIGATTEDSPRREASASVEVSGQARQHVRLRLPERWTLTGRLVDEHGEPLGGLRLRAQGSSAEDASVTTASGADGRFSLPGLPGGLCLSLLLSSEHATDLAILAESSRGLQARLPSTVPRMVCPEQPHVELVLKALPQVQGRVVDEHGAPLTVFQLDGQPRTHPEGRFSAPVGSWRWRLSLAAPGRDTVELQRPDAPADVGDVVLKKAQWVHGQVVDATVYPDFCVQGTTGGEYGLRSTSQR